MQPQRFGLSPQYVVVSEGEAHGGHGVFVKVAETGRSSDSEDRTFDVLDGSDFLNGGIEVELNGRVSPNISRFSRMFSRGFIGVCFRISADMSTAECIYLRPENGPVEDEARKNHAVQYVSMPDYGFARLRDESPEVYEAAANIQPATWHKIRIEVAGRTARLFIDGSDAPVLEVDDLKLGDGQRGLVGLWVGPGTNGLFRNLILTHVD